jgi:RNA polymerase sigma factor (sigma-70 family)
MVNSNVMESSDANLVAESLSGNREAFGQVVARYQTLICSLAYSGTGSLTQSEDLAQETFIAAWRQLASLREPEKLRSWLCGIARNHIYDALKKRGREPSNAAEALDALHESQATEPLPHDLTIHKEEEAILWRSVERIPEIYREPLVLFYREHQSIEAVAKNLELSEDAVKQRLSRGRKLLHEQVLAFVEGALERTNPGKAFTLVVLAALPGLTITAKAATVGAAAAKGSSMAKAAGTLGLFTMILNPLIVLFGNFIPYRMALAEADSDEERRRIKSFYGRICALSFGLSLPLTAVLYLLFHNQPAGHFSGGELFVTWFVSLVVIYLLAIFSFAIATAGKRRAYSSRVLAEKYGGVFPKPAWEYCSKIKLFGLPLVHIRIGDRFDLLRKPVTAWIAVGRFAFGGLFAFGEVAVAPFCIGGLALGLLPFGGIVAGILPLGGLALGVWAFGAIAIGWQSIGGYAIAWSAAVGDFAVAHNFALGGIAHAVQANTDAAKHFVESNLFFQWIKLLEGHWSWMNSLWIVPLFILWRLIARSHRNKQGNS